MPLSEFLKTGKATITAPITPQQTGNSLSNFLTGTKPTEPITEEKEIPKKKSKLKSAWNWLGKQLMKPHGALIKEFRGIGEAIGNLISIASSRVTAEEGTKKAAEAIVTAQEGAWNVLRGGEEATLEKELIKVGIQPTALDKAMSIGGEIVVDPLWIIKPIKMAKAGLKLARLEKPVATLAQLIKRTPSAQKLRTLFSNVTLDKEFNQVVQKFRNLREYREANLIDDAVQLQKDIRMFKRQGIKNAEEIITEGLENPASLTKITNEKVINITNTLRKTYKDLLDYSRKIGLSIGEIKDYAPHIRTKESWANSLRRGLGLGAREWGKGAIERGRKLKGTIKELEAKGIDIFEKNPAIQLARKGQAYAKAITSQEFANAVRKFAIRDGVKVTNPMLKELKFAPDQAKVIDNFYQGIRPKELNVIIKSFDKVQSWWKAQALISPSYHIRNIAGNLWNNFIAGVNPAYYLKAMAIQKGNVKNAKLVDEMRKLNVINQGWYAKDIGEEILNRVSGVGNWRKGINPLAQQNYLFRLNKATGSTIENNARIAHYLSMKDKGMGAAEAAQSVKKYLFDYGDLTSFEKNILKRAIPFYTWTRKNLPIQLEGILTQPAKYSLPHKIQRELESGIAVPNERYMSHYIKENIPVRIRTNKEGDTEYFLLGNWLPYASAIDLLSNPLEKVISMGTPFLKTPYEFYSNKSLFFKTTTGEYSPIERRYKQQAEFLGQSMRRKNILLLRNIRLLNDINKWLDKQDPLATKDSWQVKALNTLFGKTATYNIGISKYFYDLDTNDRVAELKKAIRDASKRGYEKKANELRLELQEFQQVRRGE